jgi:hypothetical protein
MVEELFYISEDGEKTLICVGKFDPSGFPIVTSRHFGNLATATLQAISLASLIKQTIQTEPLQHLLLRLADGSIVRVESHEEGFIAYLQMPIE